MSKLPTYDPARTFDATSLTAIYQDVGSVLASAAYGFIIYNTADVDVQISFDDGTSDGPIIPAGGTFGDNRETWDGRTEDGRFSLPEAAQIQVKQVTAAGTVGDVIVNIKRM